MNLQTIFNQAVQHIMRQGWGSCDKGGLKYRDSRGRKCVVGYFIPEHRYRETLEGMPPSMLAIELAVAPEYSHHQKQLNLLLRLDRAHCKAFDVMPPKVGSLAEHYYLSVFANECDKIAARYGLIVPRVLTDQFWHTYPYDLPPEPDNPAEAYTGLSSAISF